MTLQSLLEQEPEALARALEECPERANALLVVADGAEGPEFQQHMNSLGLLIYNQVTAYFRHTHQRNLAQPKSRHGQINTRLEFGGD